MPRKRRKTRYNRKSSNRNTRRTRGSYTGNSKLMARRGKESYTKGHLFEDVVFKYFELLGYSVSKNVVKTGFSGARHEIDVLIEKDGNIGIVEAKNYSRPVPKEWVMKAYNIAKDIGAKEVYVISSSGFTDGAKKVAEILNVKLLNLNDMVREVKKKRSLIRAKKGFMKPVYGTRKAKEHSLRFAIRRLFRIIEKPVNVELLYIPMYLLYGIHKYYEEEGLIFKRYVERYKETKILIDGIKGRLVVLGENNTIDFVDIPRLSDNEKLLLKVITEYDEVTYRDLLEETGWSRQKLSRTLNALRNKELIDISDEEKEHVYYSLFPGINELDETSNTLIDESLINSGLPNTGKVLDVCVDVNNMISLLRSLYDFNVKDYQLVYLPLYRVTMRKIDENTYRYVYLAGWIDEPTEVAI